MTIALVSPAMTAAFHSEPLQLPAEEDPGLAQLRLLRLLFIHVRSLPLLLTSAEQGLQLAFSSERSASDGCCSLFPPP